MAKKIEFKLNIEGLRELMKSPEMGAVISEATDTVLNAAVGMGADGYSSLVKTADYVTLGKVFPTDAASAKDNYENNTLVKALGSAGLKMGK